MVTTYKEENIIYIYISCSGVYMDQTIGGGGIYEWSGQRRGGQILLLNEIIQHYH
jgi:hypothetical protein